MGRHFLLCYIFSDSRGCLPAIAVSCPGPVESLEDTNLVTLVKHTNEGQRVCFFQPTTSVTCILQTPPDPPPTPATLAFEIWLTVQGKQQVSSIIYLKCKANTFQAWDNLTSVWCLIVNVKECCLTITKTETKLDTEWVVKAHCIFEGSFTWL